MFFNTVSYRKVGISFFFVGLIKLVLMPIPLGVSEDKHFNLFFPFFQVYPGVHTIPVLAEK